MDKQKAIDILSEVKELDDSMYQYNPAYMEALDMGIAALTVVNTIEKKDDEIPTSIIMKIPEDKKLYDPVERPSHYAHGNFECIDVMLDVYGKEAVEHFCLLNAFKYIWRSEHKNGLQDIQKAIWYLNHLIELEGLDE